MPQRQSSRLKAHDSDNPVGGACDVMRHAFLRWTVRALTHMRLFVGVRSLSRASRSEQVRLRHRHANTNQVSAVEMPDAEEWRSVRYRTDRVRACPYSRGLTRPAILRHIAAMADHSWRLEESGNREQKKQDQKE